MRRWDPEDSVGGVHDASGNLLDSVRHVPEDAATYEDDVSLRSAQRSLLFEPPTSCSAVSLDDSRMGGAESVEGAVLHCQQRILDGGNDAMLHGRYGDEEAATCPQASQQNGLRNSQAAGFAALRRIAGVSGTAENAASPEAAQQTVSDHPQDSRVAAPRSISGTAEDAAFLRQPQISSSGGTSPVDRDLRQPGSAPCGEAEDEVAQQDSLHSMPAHDDSPGCDENLPNHVTSQPETELLAGCKHNRGSPPEGSVQTDHTGPLTLDHSKALYRDAWQAEDCSSYQLPLRSQRSR